MNEIIKVNYEGENPTVSARDLYDALSGENGTKGTERFSKWFDRYCGYGFSEGEDYSNPYQKLRVQKEGNREVQREVEDYDLSVDMAKQICMLQKTERGKQIRQYLIDLDKAWNTPEQVMARALEIAHKTIDKIKNQNAILIEDNERMKPKEEFFDAVAGSKDAIEIGKVAKVLNYPGIGRNKLFEILREKGCADERQYSVPKIYRQWLFSYHRAKISYARRRNEDKHKDTCVSERRGLYKKNFGGSLAYLFLIFCRNSSGFMVEYGSKVVKEVKMKKLKTILLAGVLAISIAACGEKGETEEPKDETSQETESDGSVEGEAKEQAKDEDEMSQSEWVEAYGNDKMEDGHEKVEAINIDSGDAKITYKHSERYTLENGDEVFMVYFDFSNVNAAQTTIDAQYNFTAFQDGVEITVYSLIWDEFEAAQNRNKQILAGATIEVAVAIAPDNWVSPIKLRVNDDMGYDDINVVHTYQQQELNLQ